MNSRNMSYKTARTKIRDKERERIFESGVLDSEATGWLAWSKTSRLLRTAFAFNIILLIIAIFGIVIRLIHLIQNNAFYGDEIALYNNVKDKNYFELLQNLNFTQTSPVFFLFFSKIIFELTNLMPQYSIDLFLRLLPFVCGVLSIFVFYKFINLIFADKIDKICSFILFNFNTQCIAYCAIFKQYSLELLVSLILLIISYNIVFKDVCKLKYIVFISISLWLSFSSIFIVFPLFIFLFIKNKKVFFNTMLPYIINFILLFSVSLKHILSKSFFEMKTCWHSLDFGFFSLIHPQRILIRLGEFFVFGASSPYKIVTSIIGFLIIVAIVSFIFSKSISSKNKFFILSPIVLVFCASALEIYPIVARLILFIYPLFVVIMVSYSLKYKKIYISIMLLTAILSTIYYIPAFKVTENNRNYIEYNKGYLNLETKDKVQFEY